MAAEEAAMNETRLADTVEDLEGAPRLNVSPSRNQTDEEREFRAMKVAVSVWSNPGVPWSARGHVCPCPPGRSLVVCATESEGCLNVGGR